VDDKLGCDGEKLRQGGRVSEVEGAAVAAQIGKVNEHLSG
jgi:hypothetical protein